MNLRRLRMIQILLCCVILALPMVRALGRTVAENRFWLDLIEIACFAALLVCVRLHRCPHCINGWGSEYKRGAPTAVKY